MFQILREAGTVTTPSGIEAEESERNRRGWQDAGTLGDRPADEAERADGVVLN